MLIASHPNTSSSRLAHLTLPSSIVHSSESHNWDGFVLEDHRFPEGERIETATDRHVLWLLTTSSSGEYAGPRGRLIQCNGPGTLSVTPVGVVPAWHSHEPGEVILCALDSTYVGNILSELDRRPSLEPIVRHKIQNPAIRRIMTLLSEEVRTGAPSGRLYADSLAHALAIQYLQLGERAESRKRASVVSALPPYILRRVLDRIERSFQSEISLASLTQEAGYSRGHFLKMFRASMGMTPHRYVLNRRVEHARSLLKLRKMPIIEVAAECGFSSQAHLTHVFREHVGVTPAEYRRTQ
jgi:AraC family transcriptional regulator